jgi:hypothetical protein
MAKYDDYATTLCKDIPPSDVDILIRTFIKEAEIDMGSELDEVAIPRVVEFVNKDYNHLPLYSVRGAFKKGALGQYGPGRMTPRTINGWLSEMSTTFLNQSKGIAEGIEMKKWDGLHKYPVGKAICLKIDWYNAGLMSIDDWDRVDLKVLAEMIGRGERPTTRDFGIKN